MKCGDISKFREIMESFKSETGQYPIKNDVVRFVQPLFEIDISVEYAKLVYKNDPKQTMQGGGAKKPCRAIRDQQCQHTNAD